MKEKVLSLFRTHKEVILYLFFGGLTTLISIISFYLFRKMGINELIANVISWILAVSFAFFTNQRWVFDAKAKTKGEFFQQLVSFFAGRLATLGVEEVLLLIFITWLRFPDMPVKIAAQIIVIVLNYVISKLFVFKKKK